MRRNRKIQRIKNKIKYKIYNVKNLVNINILLNIVFIILQIIGLLLHRFNFIWSLIIIGISVYNIYQQLKYNGYYNNKVNNIILSLLIIGTLVEFVI